VPHKVFRKVSPRVTYRTMTDLNADVKRLLAVLPSDIDIVVGIPRQGLIPATLIAMYRNLPLADVNSFCKGEFYSGHRGRFKFADCKRALVVDDSLSSGRSLKETRKKIAEAGLQVEILYAVLYVTPGHTQMVDYYIEAIPQPRMFEWNVGDSPLISDACVDIDGVLCADPEAREPSEGYSKHVQEAKPLLVPAYPIGTVVTGRKERYRDDTEKWLKENRIKYGGLLMQPDDSDRGILSHGSFKKQVFENISHPLFIESNPEEAQIIRQAGQVIVPAHQGKTKLNILLHIMGLKLPGGASISCCEIAEALSLRGHNVKITGHDALKRGYEPLMTSESIDALYLWSDVVLVHWFKSPEAIRLTRKIPRPRVHYICDQGSVKRLRITDAALLIFNSYWLMQDTQWKGEQMVIHPPCYPEKFRTTPGDAILMVSPIKSKGIDLFLRIAKRMPERKFVIAQGRTSRVPVVPGNVKLLGHLTDPKEIYAHARLVLMPSRQDVQHSQLTKSNHNWVEGYGRVAIEAAWSGIPTIGSSESKGLRECLGTGGMFAGQDDIAEWLRLITKLDDPQFYKEKSDYALKLAELRHPDTYIDELEERLFAIVKS